MNRKIAEKEISIKMISTGDGYCLNMYLYDH